MAIGHLDVHALRRLLAAGEELALLDVREQGVHSQGHPFYAVSAPLSRLELAARALLPRPTLPIVLLDDGGDDLAPFAAEVLERLEYHNVAILEGGCAAWVEAGHELFSGVNVPSKAFGEFVEHHDNTPRISAAELRAMQLAGERFVIVDSRPFEEFHRMNIPGAVDMPGAELVWRIHELAPDPATTIVVNCAGRTRSIIGCQSLRNAGLANRVVALKDGTMGWELAGLPCERGATRVASPPSGPAVALARAAARRVAERFAVSFVDGATVRAWQADPQRTLYLLDVRGPAEFAAQHIARSRNAPGGQLVQATDEYVAARSARIVLVDPEQVRAIMTASWLNQMGLPDVHVLLPEGADGFAGWQTETGPRRSEPMAPLWRTIDPEALAERLTDPGLAVINLASSLRHRRRHVAGAWWAVRARLGETQQALARLAALRTIVLTADEPDLAELAAPQAASLWPDAEVLVLAGGNAAWFDARLPVGVGLERATTRTDDVWYKPYDHASEYHAHARAYLEWEVGLVEQIGRDETIRFRRY